MRVRFEYSGSHRLVSLQDFGAAGGFINLSLSLRPTACASLTPSTNATCWEDLDHVYAAIVGYAQRPNLTLDPTVSCGQVTAMWTSLALLAWQQAPSFEGSATRQVACFGVGGYEPLPGDDVASSAAVWPDAPAPPGHHGPLQFSLQYAIPTKHDLYTLVLYNCLGKELSAVGEASFIGGGGERLSTHQHAVLAVHLGLFSVALFAAGALALFNRYHRATALPLHGLLVVVLLLRVMQEAFLLLPLLMTMLDAVSSATEGSASANAHTAAVSSGSEQSVGGSSDAGGLSTHGMGDDSAAGVVQQCLALGAAAARQLSSLAFFTALLAFAGGRHFLAPVLPAREREALTIAFVLYPIFGIVEEMCTGEMLCGVFVLSFQVIKILMVFGVLIFLNAAADQLRRASGHAWSQLRTDLLRLVTFRRLRIQVLMIYLILPIVFMFLEVILDWRSTWFKLLWRDCLELYIVIAFASRVLPTPANYEVHFAPLRPTSTTTPAPSTYAWFFRWLLGIYVDVTRADAAATQATAARS